MKIKSFLLIFLLSSQITLGFNGELYIISNSTKSFTITISTDGYAWSWDAVNSKVIVVPNLFEFNGSGTTFIFDAPKKC